MIAELLSQANNLATFSGFISPARIIFRRRDFPLTINLLVTARCNLDCFICTGKGLRNANTELTLREITGFAAAVAPYKPAVFIGGGEPFLRGDIFDILAALRKSGLKFGMVTNGTLLNAAKIDRLIAAGPAVMMFSFHGQKRTHDKVTQNAGTFDVLCANAAYLAKKRKKTRVLLNCVISENNYHELEEMVKLGKSLKVDRVRFEHLVFLTARENAEQEKFCARNSDNGQLMPVTYLRRQPANDMSSALRTSILRLQKKYGFFVQFKPYLNAREIGSWYRENFAIKRKCLFIGHSLFINHNGDIIPCQFYPRYVLGNIRQDELPAVWQSEKRAAFKRMLNNRLLPACMRCCKL